jgi:hypothetical protein
MILPTIPPAVYEARPLLKEVRDGAHRRGAPADAVLWSFLVTAAADIPAHVAYDTGIGSPVRPTLFAVLAGLSGVGKSMAWGVAQALYGPGPTPHPPNTGEGLVETYYGRVQRMMPQGGDKPDKLVWIRERVRSNALFFLDEGEQLLKTAEKPGSLTGVTLRTMWSGGTAGQKNATEGLERVLEAGTYTAGLVIGLQPDISGQLLADTGTGTAQRFVWAASTDATLPGQMPSRTPLSAILHPTPPQAVARGTLEGFMTQGTTPDLFTRPAAEPVTPLLMTLDPSIVAVLWANRHAVATGVSQPDEYDSQRPAMHIKVAGVLAWLDQRVYITVEDWHLAAALLDASDAVRSALIEHGEAVKREGYAIANIEADVAATQTTQETYQRCTGRVWQVLQERGPTSAGHLRKALSKPQRVALNEVLRGGVVAGWLRESGVTYNGQIGCSYELNPEYKQ